VLREHGPELRGYVAHHAYPQATLAKRAQHRPGVGKGQPRVRVHHLLVEDTREPRRDAIRAPEEVRPDPAVRLHREVSPLCDLLWRLPRGPELVPERGR